MSAPTILSLRVGDIVMDARGVFGHVRSFTRDRVSVRWDVDDLAWYTDADLRECGIVLVEGQ